MINTKPGVHVVFKTVPL